MLEKKESADSRCWFWERSSCVVEKKKRERLGEGKKREEGECSYLSR